MNKINILRELFVELFEKLKTETGNDSSTKSGCFQFFVDKILEEKYHKIHIVSSKSMTNYYNKFVENKENTAGKPKSELKDLIANYLGYQDYRSFEDSISEKGTETNLRKENKSLDSAKFIKINKEVIEIYKTKKPLSVKIIISISILVISILFFTYKYTSNSSEDCIIWKENHFETSSCKNPKAIDNTIYKVAIYNFKKIEVTKETPFFKNGKQIVWYGKSASRKMEYFNHRGIHPETLKELNPVTEYIINKYIFTEKSDKTILNEKSN